MWSWVMKGNGIILICLENIISVVHAHIFAKIDNGEICFSHVLVHERK